MASKRYNEKKARQAAFAIDKELDSGYGKADFDSNANMDARDAAMGKGEEELFEKKMSKEERKAAAKAAREAKKKAKGKTNGKTNGKKKAEEPDKTDENKDPSQLLHDVGESTDAKREAALEELSKQHISVTYETKKGKLHANTRDINVSGVTVNFHGKPLIEETDLVINYGNRYGFIGPNGRYVV